MTDKKVLVVSQYFWPEDFRVNDLVRGFSDKGYIVEVLTSVPNYPSGIVFPEYKHDPKKFSYYKDIVIHRVPQFSRGKNKLTLAINYLSFVLSACFYCLLKLRKTRYDIVFTVQLSPIFSVIPAILCKFIFQTPLYIWVLDIWPDSLTTANIKTNSFIYKMLEKFCSAIYSSADYLLLSSKGFKKRLIEMQVNKPELVYFPQWVEEVYLHSIEFGGFKDKEVKKIISRWPQKKIFLFAGNIGEAQDFPNVLQSFKNASCIDELVFLIIGDGRYKDSVIELINSYGLSDNVFLLGRYASSYMPFFYHYADVLVFSLSNAPIFELTLPGKVQSYMSSGTPVIGMVNGEAALLIEDANCGFTAGSGEVKEFANLIDDLCIVSKAESNILGDNGKSYALRYFSYNSLINKVIHYFE